MWNSPWIIGTSRIIPKYSGEDGCLRHWVSWNRGLIPEYQLSLPPPPPSSQGDDAKDITPVQE